MAEKDKKSADTSGSHKTKKHKKKKKMTCKRLMRKCCRAICPCMKKKKKHKHKKKAEGAHH